MKSRDSFTWFGSNFLPAECPPFVTLWNLLYMVLQCIYLKLAIPVLILYPRGKQTYPGKVTSKTTYSKTLGDIKIQKLF